MAPCQRILGIDPGFATLGFGVIDGGVGDNLAGVAVVDFGVITTPAGASAGDRLATLYTDLHHLIEQFQPQQVAMEKLFFYRMGNTILVAQARGVVLLVLAQHRFTPAEYTPAQIKQALTGYGNADKAMVQAAVAQELNLTTVPKPDDAADGLAVALTAWFQR